jgi:DNA-binding GntR family transcriptional regulator
MSLAKIPNRTDYVDEIYKSLLNAISAGVLAPGERITQEDLAEKYNVSRSPVLQALRLLKKDGLLEEAPGRGLVVAQFGPEGSQREWLMELLEPTEFEVGRG